ncbi:MAG: hypothetical protein ACRCYU_17820 [Nocardioides sp.]
MPTLGVRLAAPRAVAVVEIARVLEAARVLLAAAGDAADARCERASAARFHTAANDVARVQGVLVRHSVGQDL